ncbi:MAG: hypothetical protein A2Y15_01745 [Clostridiales bacterium GWF2_36_10]|nr:MAG: hypothetical protein A2Y15_01745 [Clostridiales bacterium GWF2_36_10]
MEKNTRVNTILTSHNYSEKIIYDYYPIIEFVDDSGKKIILKHPNLMGILKLLQQKMLLFTTLIV